MKSSAKDIFVTKKKPAEVAERRSRSLFVEITARRFDACTRFARPGVILMHVAPPEDESPAGRDSREQFDMSTRSTGARGRTFEIIAPPQHISASRVLLSYLNFYICDGAVVTAAFGDPDVDELETKLSSAFSDRAVEMLRLASLYKGGGGVHCVTQQQPRQRTTAS
jgi:agmatine deiminase